MFSKQKGLTLVFRNDPLESLKVSSTFDSIQFVRDYLQRTIEGKLRDLMMEELPAIIHRLSLQLWCPDQVPKEDEELKEDGEPAVDPLATPPLDAVDAKGHLLDPAEISSLSLDGGTEVHSLFSQKNLLRLTTLSDSHRTLALLSPNMHDVLVRAWAGPSERLDATNTPPLTTPSLVKSQSFHGGSTTYTFSDTSSQDHGHLPSRPSMVSLHSATTGLALGSGRHSKPGRRKKTRVIDLRRKAVSEANSEAGDSSTETETASVQGPMSEPIISTSIPEEEEEAMNGTLTPGKVRFMASLDMPQPLPRSPLGPHAVSSMAAPIVPQEQGEAVKQRAKRSEKESAGLRRAGERTVPLAVDLKDGPLPQEWANRRGPQSDTSSVVLEQAWIMKMASEIARRVYDEKNRNPGFWEGRDDIPPPAYEANMDA